MDLLSASPDATLDRYIGCYDGYATSHHDALDKDEAVQIEARNVAHAVVEASKLRREGHFPSVNGSQKDPRPK